MDYLYHPADDIVIEEPSKIRIPIESNWLNPFTVEYDGKYATLFGRDKNFPDFMGHGYGEMVLIPVLAEIPSRLNFTPYIQNCNYNGYVNGDTIVVAIHNCSSWEEPMH